MKSLLGLLVLLLAIGTASAQLEYPCCIGTECAILDEGDCGIMGGVFHPEWDDCGPNPCAHVNFLVFLNADNSDLILSGFREFNSMESEADNSAVNVFVLWDRSGENDAKYYWVQHDDRPALYRYVEGENRWTLPSEPDMGDGRTLARFVQWVTNVLPAGSDQLYCLVLWNHGGGWGPRGERNVSNDSHPPGSYMTINELRDALAAIAGHLGGRLDLLGFDACLMEMLEVGYAVGPSCDYMVGSEETELVNLEDAQMWEYHLILPEIAATMTSRDLGQVIVRNSFQPTRSMFPVGDGMTAIAAWADILAQAMLTNMWLERDNIWRARRDASLVTYNYMGRWPVEPHSNSDSYVDIGRLCELLEANCWSNEVFEAARGLREEVDAQSIAYCNNGAYYAPSRGLSIYFPVCQPDHGYYTNYMNRNPVDSLNAHLDFVRDTHWDEFLADLLEGGGGPSPVEIALSDVSVTALEFGVELSWRLDAPVPNADLMIYRSESVEEAGGLIATLDPVAGAVQTFTDATAAPAHTYYYWIQVAWPGGASERFGPWAIGATTASRPVVLASGPNPIHGETSLKLYLPRNIDVRWGIYGTDGRLVRSLPSAPLSSGIHTLQWDGQDQDGRRVQSGAYFYSIEAGVYKLTGRLTVVR